MDDHGNQAEDRAYNKDSLGSLGHGRDEEERIKHNFVAGAQTAGGRDMGPTPTKNYTTASIPLYPNGHLPSLYELEEKLNGVVKQMQSIRQLLQLLNDPSPTLYSTMRGLSLLRELGYRP